MDLLLDSLTHDLKLVGGDLSLVKKSDAVEQNLKQRYLLFFGEWFLDTTQGVPYYQFILVHNPNMDLVNSTLMNVALKTPGILELRSFELSYGPQNRELSVDLEAKASDEDITFSTSVGG